jgi:hypothetical protein
MDLSRVRSLTQFGGEDEDDHQLSKDLLKEADSYIRAFAWCKSVKETYVGDCVGGIVALVLFRIEPAVRDVDEWIWVVVGDLPPAYIAPASPDPADALDDYIYQMSRWILAVRTGGVWAARLHR